MMELSSLTSSSSSPPKKEIKETPARPTGLQFDRTGVHPVRIADARLIDSKCADEVEAHDTDTADALLRTLRPDLKKHLQLIRAAFATLHSIDPAADLLEVQWPREVHMSLPRGCFWNCVLGDSAVESSESQQLKTALKEFGIEQAYANYLNCNKNDKFHTVRACCGCSVGQAESRLDCFRKGCLPSAVVWRHRPDDAQYEDLVVDKN